MLHPTTRRQKHFAWKIVFALREEKICRIGLPKIIFCGAPLLKIRENALKFKTYVLQNLYLNTR